MTLGANYHHFTLVSCVRADAIQKEKRKTTGTDSLAKRSEKAKFEKKQEPRVANREEK